jgi:hypothetical protein
MIEKQMLIAESSDHEGAWCGLVESLASGHKDESGGGLGALFDGSRVARITDFRVCGCFSGTPI